MNLNLLTASVITATLLTACGGGGGGGGNPTPPPETDVINISNVEQILETNADIAFAAYSDSVTTAMALKTALEAFATAPTAELLAAAKEAWLVSREPYGQTEVYRFRLSPIDSTNYTDEDGPEGDINAWPLGEGLIDYVVSTTPSDFEDGQVVATVDAAANYAVVNYPTNTIINSTVTIDTDLISGAASENDVIAGYHAIEFMLWGQDLNNTGMVTVGTDRDTAVKTLNATGWIMGGTRPLTDFTTDPNAARRLTYLQVVADKLIADLTVVRDGWADGVADNYRDQFTTVADRDEAIQKLTEILTGMGTLSEGELAGERMQIAFSTNSQEDEHSCFSDNTHRDIWLNAEGISNSYYGDYNGYDSTLNGTDDAGTVVNGYGIDDYIADLNIDSLTTLADDFEAKLTTTETNYMEIDTSARDGSPVDVLIMDKVAANPMYKTILSLNAQSLVIADLALALDISAVVVDDDASGCPTGTPLDECN